MKWKVFVTLLLMFFSHGQGAPTTYSVTVPTVPKCPSGLPLTTDKGELVHCECPPHGFCPSTHFCRTEVQGQPGICCVKEDSIGSQPPQTDQATPAVSVGGQPQTAPSGTETTVEITAEEEETEVTEAATKVDDVSSATSVGPDIPTTPPVVPVDNTTPQLVPTAKPACPPIKVTDIKPLPQATCKYEDQKADSNGCPQPPKVVCVSIIEDCPPFAMPMIAQGCHLIEGKKDAKGCEMAPEVICNSTTTSGPVQGYLANTPPTNCPVFSMPKLQPGCNLGPGKIDANGCPTIGDITCSGSSATAGEPIGTATTQQPSGTTGQPSGTSATAGEPIGTATTQQPSGTTDQPSGTSPVPSSCPVMEVPVLGPNCHLGPPGSDANGCPITNTICATDETSVPQPTQTVAIVDVPNCPQLSIPVMAEHCHLGPPKKDKNGCTMYGDIICDNQTTVALPTQQPAPGNIPVCPALSMPKLEAHCHIGPAKTDANGCPLLGDIVCDEGTGSPHSTGHPVTGTVPANCPQLPATTQVPEDCYMEPGEPDTNGCPTAPQMKCWQGFASTPAINLQSTPGAEGTPTPISNQVPLNCPPIELDTPTLRPGCTLGLSQKDPNGCPMTPEITCGTTSGSVNPVASTAGNSIVTPGSNINCPAIDMPKLEPGCTMGPFKTDPNGCSMPGDVTCSTGVTIAPTLGTGQPITEKITDFEETPSPSICTGSEDDEEDCVPPSEQPVDQVSTGIQVVVTTAAAIDFTPAIVTLKNCPQLSMPKLSPGCHLGPTKTNANGCTIWGDIICDYESSTGQPTGTPSVPMTGSSQPQQSATSKIPSCPQIDAPHLAPGCTLGPFKTDDNGCPMPGDVICSTASVPQPTYTVAIVEVPNCPQLSMPVLAEHCHLGPPKKDKNGCTMYGDIICDNQTTVALPTQQPAPGNIPECPALSMPKLEAHCHIGPAKTDANGCPLLGDIVCDEGTGSPHSTEHPVTGTVPATSGVPLAPSTVENAITTTPLVNLSIDIVPLDVANTPSICTGTEDDAEDCVQPTAQSEVPPAEPTVSQTPAIVPIQGSSGAPVTSGTNCPQITTPPPPADCGYGEPKLDANGCPMTPELQCWQGEGGEMTAHPDSGANGTGVVVNMITTGSPGVQITTPTHVIPAIVTSSGNGGTPQPIASKATFKDMLTPEYFKLKNSEAIPDMATFHKTAGAPFISSGKFHACDVHSNCFKYREPREWCQKDSNSVWSARSCYCSQDTAIPSCIIERTQGGAQQWTFCAEFAQCAVRKLV